MNDSNCDSKESSEEVIPVAYKGLKGIHIRLKNLEYMQKCVSNDFKNEKLKLSQAIITVQSKMENKFNDLLTRFEEVQQEDQKEQLALTEKLSKMVTELVEKI